MLYCLLVIHTLLVLLTRPNNVDGFVEFRAGRQVSGARSGAKFRQNIESLDEDSCGSYEWPSSAIVRSDTRQINYEPDEWATNERLPAWKRMTGGARAKLKQFPSYVQVDSSNMSRPAENKFYTLLCGGTIVAADLIVTAAHCVRPEYYDAMTVKAGFVDIETQQKQLTEQVFGYTQQVQTANVLGYCYHKDYDRDHDEAYNSPNDLAVLQLDRKFNFTDYVQPACLQFDKLPTRSETLYAVGFGDTYGYESRSDYLNYIGVRRNKMRPAFETDSVYRSVAPGQLCIGDSGGGIFMLRHQQQYLVGVAVASSIVNDMGSYYYCRPGDHSYIEALDIFKDQYELKRLLKYCYEPAKR